MDTNRRLFSEARGVKNKLILTVCLGVLGGILGIVQAYGLAKVINQVFLQHDFLRPVVGIILALLLVVVIRAVLLYLGESSSASAAREIQNNLRHKLFSRIYSLGPAFLRSTDPHEEIRTGELVNLATEGIDALEAYYSQYMPQLALAALIPASILVFVFRTDALSGFILLFTAPLIPVFMVLIGGAAKTLTRKQWLGLSRMSAYFLDVLQGLPTLKSLGRSKAQTDIIDKVSDQYRLVTMGVLKVTFLSALALELVATLSTAIVAVEIGIRLLYGKMAFEQAFFVLLLAPEFYLPLRQLGTRFHSSMAGVETGKRIFDILDTPSSNRLEAQTRPSPTSTQLKKTPFIEIKNIKFSYPGNPETLEGVSFDIPAGKMTAITGVSGAGKTTLTWLLLRFLEPQLGEILVDGKPLSEIPNSEWVASVAWVPQNPYLFDDTVAANILLARPTAELSDVHQAARYAGADDFIRSMPQGYQTPIGERGVRLSAGQAQRIALARAFLKDAPFIILDEATSHLDPMTDAQLQASMQQLFYNRTVLVIAHRKTTISRADLVVKLDNGQVNQAPRQNVPLEKPPFAWEQNLPVERMYPGASVNDGINLPPVAGKSADRKPSTLVRLFITLAPFWLRITLSVFLGFATVASGVGLMATSAYIISAAALHPSIAELQVAIVGVRFFGLSRGVFRYLERLVSHDVTFRLLSRWRVKFYQALEPLAPAWLQRYHSGDLLARVIRDIGTLENFYIRAINPPMVALLVSIIALLFLGGFGEPLAWGLLVFLLLAGILLPVMVYFLSRKLGPALIKARSNFNSLLVDSVQGLPDLATNGRIGSQLEQIRKNGDAVAHLQGRMSAISLMHTTLGNLLANLSMLTVLVLGILLVSAGQLEGVFLGVVTLTALTCFEAMTPLPQMVQYLQANQAAAQRLYELVDAPKPVSFPHAAADIAGDINLQVQDLSFTYPNWENSHNNEDELSFTLKNISFNLPQGKHIAVIGPSGAGKTTLVNLMLRYWDYQYGSILLNGRELGQYNPDELRAHIAYVSQNDYLFCATIKDNLLLARPSATIEQVMHAAKQAQLDDFIQSLPAGYDTWIGEHGLRLSAGERQRLAVARAFLKDTPLLILDEPAANLDPQNELDLIDAVNLFSQGRSMIYITQNMSGLEAMDEIIVLKYGQIIERGSHTSLYASAGLYRQMWDLYHQIM